MGAAVAAISGVGCYYDECYDGDLSNDQEIEELIRKAKAEAKAEGEDLGDGDEDEEGEASQPQQPQFSQEQIRSLLSELNPKLRQELCHVLEAQRNPNSNGEAPRVSPELSRILHRFQRRTERAREQGGEEETWPMYLGLFLIVGIALFLLYIWWEEEQLLYQEAQLEMEREATDPHWHPKDEIFGDDDL
eukprot:gnl/TRDRNA2_/TRDRNA2_171619_c0_seq5.p1 gnl/TRDRNA2_/TRDRNA2_171619_c0~~gnl/TRDRNA2_/TRDRNA2_171619_c0_seq5.p1  ORF type:complete len:190 (-),score=50.53 gnl/TRDRNA2_/TRDRNA2_171619_c0_seq5:144-713(-)